jgi:hypothetical protein
MNPNKGQRDVAKRLDRPASNKTSKGEKKMESKILVAA